MALAGIGKFVNSFVAFINRFVAFIEGFVAFIESFVAVIKSELTDLLKLSLSQFL